jgi:hypothetical protein
MLERLKLDVEYSESGYRIDYVGASGFFICKNRHSHEGDVEALRRFLATYPNNHVDLQVIANPFVDREGTKQVIAQRRPTLQTLVDEHNGRLAA